jgi:alpha-galactosidase
MSPLQPVSSIIFRDEPEYAQIAMSGLGVLVESLWRGRFGRRQFSSQGFLAQGLVATHDVPGFQPSDPGALSLPFEAFDVEIDGQSLQGGWEWVAAHLHEDERPGLQHAVIHLRSTHRPIELEVHTVVDGTGMIVRWLEIMNMRDEPAALSRVAPWCGLLWRGDGYTRPSHPQYVGAERPAFVLGRCMSEEWGQEGAFRWMPLLPDTLRVEHIKGTSGNDDPAFIVRNELTGEITIGALAWSGNWALSFRTRPLDLAASWENAPTWIEIRAEPFGDPPLRVIAPGESVTTPAMHIGVFRGDVDAAVQALHEHERRTVLAAQPEGRGERVIYNHWGYAAHDMNPDYLTAEIDVAAEIGAELFMVDAGWFSPLGREWSDTVGDWRPDPERLPGGLGPIREYAHSKGLLLGLWVEAERVGPDSWVAREHPEWVLQRDDQPVTPTPAGGGTLNLSNPDCAAWLEAEINRIVDEYQLDMFRLDYNFYPGRGGETPHDGFVESSFWRHYEVLYGIFDRLREKHPELLLENCAGGGGRKDLGIAARFHTYWTSDWQSLPRTVQVISGVSLFLPPERLNRLAGAGQIAFVHSDVDTQLRVPLFGHYSISGVAPTQDTWNAGQRERVLHAVKLYKEFIRPWLPHCRVYHHTPQLAGGGEPHGWAVLEYVAADGSRAMAGLFRLAGDAAPTYRFHARGLNRGARYRVTFDNSGQVTELGGQEIVDHGIEVRLEQPLTSELLLFERIQA